MPSLSEIISDPKARDVSWSSPTSRGKEKDKEAVEEKSKGLQNWLRSKGFGGDVGAFVDNAAQAITLGTADEAKAKLFSMLGSGDYEENLKNIRGTSEQLDEEHGVASTLGTIGGSLLSAAATPGLGPAKTLASAAGKGAIEGAVYSGAQAAGEAEGGAGQRAKAAVDGALWGGAFGSAFATGGKAISGLLGKAKRTANRPTVKGLEDVTKADYAAVDASGAYVDPSKLQTMTRKMVADVRGNTSYMGEASKNSDVEATLNHFEKLFDPKRVKGKKTPTVQPISMLQLDELRQDVWDTYRKTNSPRALDIINHINDTLDTLPEGPLLNKARASNRRAQQAKFLEHMVDKVETSSQAGHTMNTAAKYRTAISNIVTNPKVARNFDPPQLQTMREILDSGWSDKAMDIIGKGAPTGNGLLQTIMIIGAIHNPVVLGAAMGASGARYMSNMRTKGKVQSLLDDVAGVTASNAGTTTGRGTVPQAITRQSAAGLPSIMEMLMPQEAQQAQEQGNLPLLDMMMQKQGLGQ